MGASLLVFANKTDINACMSSQEIREVNDSVEWFSMKGMELILGPQGLQLDTIKTHTWAIIQCSAITGERLTEGLDWVVQEARERLFLY